MPFEKSFGLQNNAIIHLGRTPVNVSDIQRGVWKGSSHTDRNYEPPSITLYTHFSLQEYFLIFWGILTIQSIIILITKQSWSLEFKHLNWLEKVLHSVENSHFPFPIHDWDHGKGNCDDHFNRMRRNQTEIIISSYWH